MKRRTPRAEVYKAADGWRWRFMRNGRIRADGGQGYSRHVDCVAGMCDVLSIVSAESGRMWRNTSDGTEEVRLDDELTS